MNRPIEIIGGGLSGLALGAALRRADVPVTIFEAGDYPRHRVCGEFITGLDEKTMARLGLAPFLADATRHHRIAWCLQDAPVRVQTLPSPALGLSRHALDARLAEEFVRLGGELRTHTRVAGDAAPARTRLCDRPPPRPAGVARLEIPCARPRARGRPRAASRRSAYVGLSPVEDGAVNVCVDFFISAKMSAANARRC